jgi:hypothetical protein
MTYLSKLLLVFLVLLLSFSERSLGNMNDNQHITSAQEVRISLGGTPCWIPDYVFADNYKLTSIDELEKFIKSNKHLPGIPNAEDVANNGIELGDMQARMLQKIEELTLYIIELKKENEEIKKMVNTKKE